MNTNSPKNDSFNSANSPTLNEKLAEQKFPLNIEDKFSDLANLWLDINLLNEFREKIWEIVSDNPESAGIVNNELDRTAMLLEEQKPYYLRRVSNLAWVIANWWNLDDFFWRSAANDEDFRLSA